MLFQISPSTNATQNLLLGSNKWAYTTTKGGDNLQQLAVTSKRILLFWKHNSFEERQRQGQVGGALCGNYFWRKVSGGFRVYPTPKIQNSIWLLPSDRVDYSWQSEADSQRVTFNNSCDFLLTLISPLESLWSPFKGGDLACYVFHAGSFDIKVSISFFLFEQQCDELICFRTNQC